MEYYLFKQETKRRELPTSEYKKIKHYYTKEFLTNFYRKSIVTSYLFQKKVD